MIWIQTLILLVIAVLLARQALAEKAHFLQRAEQDPSLLEDEGFYMTLSRRFRPDPAEMDRPWSDSGSLFARAVSRTQRHLAAPENRLERRIRQSSTQDDSGTVIERAVRASHRLNDRIDGAVERRIQRQQARAGSNDVAAPLAEDSWFSRVTQRVQRQGDRVDARLSERAARLSGDSALPRTGVFGRSVGRVAERQQNDAGLFAQSVHRMRQRIDRQQTPPLAAEEDLLTRTAQRLVQPPAGTR